MKKRIRHLLIAVAGFAILTAVTACGAPGKAPAGSGSASGSAAAETPAELQKIVIGVSPAPHAEIIEALKDDFKAEGLDVEARVFNDYVTPNKALDAGDIDANYFQHIPYFESFVKDNNLNLEILGGVHIEPMGIFSTKYKSLAEVQDGAEVQFPNDPTNGGRALLLLQSQGLIKLKDGGSVDSNETDIVENPKHLRFTALEAALIPTTYQDAGLAVINGNYALQHGINPVKDALALEGPDSPYVNIVAVRKGDAQKDTFQKLLRVLQSDHCKQFIEESYGGSAVPAFTRPQS